MVNPTHRQAVVRLLNSANYPSGALNKSEAWIGILQVIPWYAHGFLHVIDANQLNPDSPRPSKTWQQRARDAAAFLETTLGMAPGTFQANSGLMWRDPLWINCVSPNQKANPAGNAFRYLGAQLLQLYSDDRFDYREEQLLSTYFPGIAIPGVPAPAADILAVEHVGAKPVALISCKWSMRIDRVSEAQRECGHVKSVAHRLYGSVRFYILCHEYGMSRVQKLLNDTCVDGLILVNLPVVQHLGLMTTQLQNEITNGRLLSLEQFLDLTYDWK